MTSSFSSIPPSRHTMTNVTYYDLLQVRRDADEAEIRLAYRRMAKTHHPDTNPIDRQLAAARFRLIQEAYDHLRDPLKRREYDQDLKAQAWFALSPYNDNPREEHASDLFSSARRTLERLMRLMATTRDISLKKTPPAQDGRHV